MNTTSLNLLAETILAAQTKDRTPMGIAFAIASAGQHLTPEITAELSRLRARVAELESGRNRETAEWLGKKAREYRSTRGREHALQAEVLERMADKVRRGAIRPALALEDPHDSPLHHTYTTGRDIEFPQQEAPRV
jgi:predicted 2-oxoglutarate/Fe(II)-dependent dioxygenase YbiX